ncbi:Diphosphomevalonate decarboxylase [Nosema bombycis CQ1]|uniref:Diphosphomevalonate decarboxylase n=1 Tax=Nosema bombycis (strain CQ1 / CVCC 102059) TaxID=578461 RepID=R0KPX2_NOSB1|nr:Diphosphomevalonate decarboxylase [Nosema bombycis CQ1]|eukprot:EOB12247.1 Diphosphomevalonate decarboxylase [Nosema bombycis CQ1]
MNKFTTTSHPNIAIIKYWGKDNIDLNIPSNSSISFPLTKLITTTTIEYSEVDKFILNNKQEEIPLRIKVSFQNLEKL